MSAPRTYAERVAKALWDLAITALCMSLILAALVTWAAVYAPERLPQ